MDIDRIQDCFGRSIQSKRDSNTANNKVINQIFNENEEINHHGEGFSSREQESIKAGRA